MIKILGGIARGFILATPKVETTRPTSILVRRKLFDWRQRMDEHSFIDLFAGSGAMGFEALSRGAEKVSFNDTHKSAFITVKQNQAAIEKAFKFSADQFFISQLDARKWIDKELKFQFPETENVVLYIDPPYSEHKIYFEVLDKLKEVNFSGEIWLESDRLKGPKKEELIGAFSSIIKIVEQGDHFVVVGKLV